MASILLTASSLFAALTASVAHAQFVTAPTDLASSTGYLDIPVRYKQVPEGICELTPGVKSYSGYVDIFEDQHVFFWFFESRQKDPENAPLTVWINGGPGSSSMIGLFQELGPCGVDSNGEIYNNPYAWNNASNMLFIDHPAQVGFSYSTPVPAYQKASEIIQLPNATCPDYAGDTCGTYSHPNLTDTATSTINAAPSMWRTLQGFMGAFPQYSRNDFSFATESYGGHWAPIFTTYIESQNALIEEEKLPGAHYIHLTTVLIGNGWYDPLVHYEAYYNYTVYPGNTYDYDPYNQSIKDQLYNSMYGKGNCYDQTVDCNTRGINEICATADSFCSTEVEHVLDVVTGRDPYDIRQLTPDPFPYRFFVHYLNIPEVQQAIGAYVNFSFTSEPVSGAFDLTGDVNREVGTIEAVRKLIDGGIYVVQYYGDADYNCNWLGGQKISQMVDAPGFASAGYENVTTSDGVVHGQVKQSQNFAFVRVYDSGHETPFYQPVLALEMFERAIDGRDIASGEEDCLQDYKTVGTAESTYRQGNSTVQFTVLPAHATYNTTTNAPNPVNGRSSAVADRSMLSMRKNKSKKRALKPTMKSKNQRR